MAIIFDYLSMIIRVNEQPMPRTIPRFAVEDTESWQWYIVDDHGINLNDEYDDPDDHIHLYIGQLLEIDGTFFRVCSDTASRAGYKEDEDQRLLVLSSSTSSVVIEMEVFFIIF